MDLATLNILWEGENQGTRKQVYLWLSVLFFTLHFVNIDVMAPKVVSEVFMTDSAWVLCLSKQICFIDGEHMHLHQIILQDRVEQTTWFLN